MNQRIISQRLLRQYYDLVRTHNQVGQQQKLLRGHLIGIARQGAGVEVGPLHYRLQRYARTPITRASIVESLGWDAYQTVVSHIIPVYSDRFVIVGADAEDVAG